MPKAPSAAPPSLAQQRMPNSESAFAISSAFSSLTNDKSGHLLRRLTKSNSCSERKLLAVGPNECAEFGAASLSSRRFTRRSRRSTNSSSPKRPAEQKRESAHFAGANTSPNDSFFETGVNAIRPITGGTNSPAVGTQQIANDRRVVFHDILKSLEFNFCKCSASVSGPASVFDCESGLVVRPRPSPLPAESARQPKSSLATVPALSLLQPPPLRFSRNRSDSQVPPSIFLLIFSNFFSVRKMSLVGKPLVYKNYSTDQRFRRVQSKMHNFLERPRGWKAASYHLAVLVMVLTCLALSVFSTMPEFEEQSTLILYYIEIIFVFWLAIEYICRVWSAGCRSRYRGIAGRIRFATSAYCVIDIIVITASLIVLCMGAREQAQLPSSPLHHRMFAASAIRGLRFFQILRMLRIDRRAGTWKLLGSVVWAHRQELLTTLYIGFLGLIFSSFLVYLCEKSYNDKYTTFADALWWGVITLSTVGYGDVTPQTWPGKIIGALCALLGISFFALPAGILGSGFALKVQQHQRQKHLIRRRVPAARLIQCLWRHYCSMPESRSLATWKVHLQTTPLIIRPCSSIGFQNNSIISRLRQSARRKMTSQNTQIQSDFPTDDGEAQETPTETLCGVNVRTLLVPNTNRPPDNISIVSSDLSEFESLGALGFSLGSWRKSSSKSYQRNDYYHKRAITSSALAVAAAAAASAEIDKVGAAHRPVVNSSSLGTLTASSPTVLQSSPKLGFSNLLPRRPSTSPEAKKDKSAIEKAIDDTFDESKDSLMSRTEEETAAEQRRKANRSLSAADPANLLLGNFWMAPWLDWIGRARAGNGGANGTEGRGGSSGEVPADESMWGQLSACSPLQQKRSNQQRRRLSAEYISDEEFPLLQLRSLDDFTPALKNAVRAIRRIQLLVARRKFKEALKPYDVKDVIEQYSAGHVDLQARVKQVQQRLDQIMGSKPSKEDMKVSLANRVIKMERHMEKIDKKLDLLVEMFLEEKRLRLVDASDKGIAVKSSSHGTFQHGMAGMTKGGAAETDNGTTICQRPKWPLAEHHSRFGLVQVPSSAVSSHVSPMANLSKVPTSLHKQLLQTQSLKIDHKLIHFPPSVLHQQQPKRPTASAKSAAFDKNRRESQTEDGETAPEGQPLLTNADANV
ncbi:hypothetical protein niasHT_001089 [Heterodera trifolii]|uniref:Uncharacterized protein n=1 Tax=Heterodera trifolii TaxID=157864 RepID=A0ABD2LVV2_9BILA